MDSFDRQIMQFMLVWAPFGGPPEEDVFPRFGLTKTQLGQRFDEIASALMSSGAEPTGCDAELLTLIRRISWDRANARVAGQERATEAVDGSNGDRADAAISRARSRRTGACGHRSRRSV